MSKTISTLLSHGSLSATPAADITALTGLDPRSIRLAVERERLAGEVILSDEHGYFLPSEDPALAETEIAAWLAQRTATANSIIKTVEIAHSALDKLRSGTSGTGEST